MRVLLAVLLALFAPPALADPAGEPQLAPAYIERQFPAIGYVTNRRPEPGGGVGIGGCTATLIAPQVVLTAAHCVAGRRRDPTRVHVTFGWTDGPPLWRAPAVRIVVAEGFSRQGAFTLETARRDAALVFLARPVPAEVLAPLPLAAPEVASDFAIWGYRRGIPTILAGHARCALTPLDAELLTSDCWLVGGFSGAPVIADLPEGPVVTAVVVAQVPGATGPVRSIALRLPPDLRALLD